MLPFANAGGNPDTEYLCDGITESLINNLSRLPALRVVPRGLSFRYKGKDIDPRDLGRELHVRALLTGKVLQRGDTLSVQAELVDVECECQLWGQRYNRKAADIFELEEEIALQISENLRLRLTGEEKEKLVRRSTENSQAYHLYLKGRYHWSKRTDEGLKKGIQYSELAIRMDPGYALAYAGLADCHAVLTFYSTAPPKQEWEKAWAAARKALELDDQLAEAHATMGVIRSLSDHQWAEGEKELFRATDLDAGSWLAQDYLAIILAAQGKYEEAGVRIERAQKLEPLSLVVHHHAGIIYNLARRYDRAIEHSLRALEMEPNYFVAFYWLGLAYQQKSMPAQALEAFRKAVDYSERNPSALPMLIHACAASGHRAEALKLLEELNGIARRRYVEPFNMALLYAGLDEPDRAFDRLDQAYDDRSSWLALFVNGDPRLDRLRPQPRFHNLLRRMRLA